MVDIRRSIAAAGWVKWPALALASVTLASSAPDEQKVLRRLVGDGSLSPAQIGPSEEIEIRLTHWWPTFGRRLGFNLRPDRILTVTRYLIRPGVPYPEGSHPEIERVDRLRLSSAAFSDFRRRLAVFRPETLAPDGPAVLPAGCHYVFDAGDKASIAYADPDNQFGVYIRQGNRECDDDNARRLDDALREILTSLPPTEAAAGFIW